MRLGQRRCQRSSWWCWAVTLLAATTLPGVAFGSSAENSPIHHAMLEGAAMLEDSPQIAIETRLITGPPSRIEALKIDWSGSFGTSLEVDPQDSTLELPVLSANDNPAKMSTAGYSRAWTVRQKKLPATIAVLNGEQATALLAQLNKPENAEQQMTSGLWKTMRSMMGYDGSAAVSDRVKVLQAPKVTVFNGQLAAVHDCLYSPFVVALHTFEGKDDKAIQPVVQTVETGLKLKVLPLLQDGGSIRLECGLALSRIVDVDTCTFTPAEDGRTGSTVQIPNVETTRLDTGVQINDGQTLLIGGLRTSDNGGNPQSMIVMLTPTIIVQADKEEPVSVKAKKSEPKESRPIMGGVTPRVIIQDGKEERIGAQQVFGLAY